MTGVIYARYSTESQREESIDAQIRECKAYAERNGIEVLKVYEDRALSAKTDNRPGFQQMVKDSAKRLFDVVIVWKLDRFARNRYDSAHYKALLRKNGVKVISATELIAEDSSGVLLESVLEGMAEYYSAELSEKVTRGHRENALNGKYNGGNLPLGYTIGPNREYLVDPLTAPVVVQCFTDYAEGKTIQQIVDILQASGIKGKHGKPATINKVTTMLKNRKYIGEYIYDNIVNRDAIPAIVPLDLFQRVQERMEKNRRAPARYKAKEEYLLTTKLYCGLCGAFMVGESGVSRGKTTYHYYKCVSNKKHRGCTKKSAKKHWIEEVVIFYTMRMIMDDAVLDDVSNKLLAFQKRENTTLPLLRKQLRGNEKAIANMLDAIQQGIFNESTKQRLDELEAAKKELNILILQEETQRPLLTKEQILFWLHKFRGLDMTRQDHRQRLIDSLVNAVRLREDGSIMFIFNGKEGVQTISADEIMREMGSDLDGLAPPKRVPYDYFHSSWNHKGLFYNA